MKPGGGRGRLTQRPLHVSAQHCIPRERGPAGVEGRQDMSVLCSSDKILGLVFLEEKQEAVDLRCNPLGKD
jgi:hypothetical protein